MIPWIDHDYFKIFICLALMSTFTSYSVYWNRCSWNNVDKLLKNQSVVKCEQIRTNYTPHPVHCLFTSRKLQSFYVPVHSEWLLFPHSWKYFTANPFTFNFIRTFLESLFILNIFADGPLFFMSPRMGERGAESFPSESLQPRKEV
jgi:hypothetical protein